MPRRRPPVDIFTWPVPDKLAHSVASCPICAEQAQPMGFVADKLVYRCPKCGARFKPSPEAEHRVSSWERR